MSWRIQFTADRLDDINFPTRGLFAESVLEDHVEAPGGQLDYTRWTTRIFLPMTRGPTTLVAAGRLGATLAGENFVVGDYRPGGFLNLSGLAPSQLIGRHVVLGNAILYHRLFDRSPIIDIPLHAGASFELGNAFDDWSRIGWRPAGSLFISADTPLGPLTFAGGAADGGQALYLILGRLF